MKKTLLICLIAIAALTGCKKDKSEAKKLVGKWMATKEVEKEFENNTQISTDTDTFEPGEFVIEFTSNELKLYDDDGSLEETYPYIISGSTITYTEEGEQRSMNLRYNNDDEIVLTQEESDSYNGINYREVNETTFIRK